MSRTGHVHTCPSEDGVCVYSGDVVVLTGRVCWPCSFLACPCNARATSFDVCFVLRLDVLGRLLQKEHNVRAYCRCRLVMYQVKLFYFLNIACTSKYHISKRSPYDLEGCLLTLETNQPQPSNRPISEGGRFDKDPAIPPKLSHDSSRSSTH